jgi:hypothetical protein
MRWLFKSEENSIALPTSDEGELRIIPWGTNCFLSEEWLQTARR